jgi:hypothetical protein
LQHKPQIPKHKTLLYLLVQYCPRAIFSSVHSLVINLGKLAGSKNRLTFFDFGSRILGAKSVKTDAAVRKSVVKPTTPKRLSADYADFRRSF